MIFIVDKESFKGYLSCVGNEKVQNNYSGVLRDSRTQFAELGLIKALERITQFNYSHVRSAFV